ncbi:MAG: glycogen/starch synthase [Cyanobacteria bacterium P01_H01_bin.74]
MKIVFCSAEVAPFSVAGGLGDVLGNLPRAVENLGYECTVITPLYGLIDKDAHQLTETHLMLDVQFYGKSYPVKIWQGVLPESNVPVTFVDNEELFGCRQEVYPYGKPEWEMEGFLVFSQAVFELLRRVHYRPDILHIHDWHTASVSTTLSEIRAFDQYFSRTSSVLTIHNLHYQGVYEDINWLREGILKTDAITTVSPTYAKEIQMPEFGAGMDDVIRQCSQKVSGILNGFDTTAHNPETVSALACNYGVDSAETGKARCKSQLQASMGLPVEANTALVSFVGKTIAQKGLDILIPAIKHFLAAGSPVQFVLLGSGEPLIEAALSQLSHTADNVTYVANYNDVLAENVYAASDIYIMPSAFEPCGLGQMLALRYGAVPIVRGVGGLVDTVVDVRSQPHQGTGFKFSDYTEEKMIETLAEALQLFENKATWASLVRRAMKEDNSWDACAKNYVRLYSQLSGNTFG